MKALESQYQTGLLMESLRSWSLLINKLETHRVDLGRETNRTLENVQKLGGHYS